jgi:hypothetical protein
VKEPKSILTVQDHGYILAAPLDHLLEIVLASQVGTDRAGGALTPIQIVSGDLHGLGIHRKLSRRLQMIQSIVFMASQQHFLANERWEERGETTERVELGIGIVFSKGSVT